MKFTVLFFVWILLTAYSWLGYGHATEDSVDMLLKKSALNDSVRCSLLGRRVAEEPDPVLKQKMAEELLSLALRIGHGDGIYNAHLFLGVAKMELGNLSSALDHYFICLELKTEDIQDRCEVLTQIARLYLRNSDYGNAIRYYDEAIGLLTQKNLILDANDKETLAIAYLNKGDAYFIMSQPDSAMFYSMLAKDSLSSLESDYAKDAWVYAVGNLGLAYAQKGQDDLAETYIQQAVDELIGKQDYYPISVYYTYMADIYVEKGDMRQALKYALESYTMADEYSLTQQLRDASLKLYELYSKNGQPGLALDYHVQYVAYKDSLTNADLIRKLADQQKEYEVGQKQAELDVMAAQQRTERIVMMAMGALAIVLIVLAFIIYKYYRSKARVNKILELQKQELESLNQTKDKFFSIISHDLRGPVTSFMGVSRMIKFMVKSQSTDDLLEMADDIDDSVKRLSSLLDNLLSWAMQQRGQVPYNPEPLNLREIAREQVATFDNMAKSKAIHIWTKVPEGLHIKGDRNMVQTILRNLINNAVKFTPQDGSITVEGRSLEGKVHLLVRDTGVGMPQEKLDQLFNLSAKKSTYGTSGEKGLGLGLQLVEEFVQIHEGEVQVRSTEGMGTVFEIVFPEVEGATFADSEAVPRPEKVIV